MIDADSGEILDESLEGLDQVHQHHIVERDEMPVPHGGIMRGIFQLLHNISPHVDSGDR